MTALTRVTVRHDTAMWNEGFEHADNPWFAFVTDDEFLIRATEKLVELWNEETKDMGREFVFSSTEPVPADEWLHEVIAAVEVAAELGFTDDDEEREFDTTYSWEYGDLRFLPVPALISIFEDRLREWTGV